MGGLRSGIGGRIANPISTLDLFTIIAGKL
jgi:hypothetical protein